MTINRLSNRKWKINDRTIEITEEVEHWNKGALNSLNETQMENFFNDIFKDLPETTKFVLLKTDHLATIEVTLQNL